MREAGVPENVSRWYFAFHAPSKESLWHRLGHVDAFGMSDTGVWIFLYPERQRFRVMVAKEDQAIDTLFAHALHVAEVIRYEHPTELTLPAFGPYTCASFCGHLVGIRAFTPWGLKRTLLRNGGVSLNEKQAHSGRPDDGAAASA
jgi:hypothetical protein